MNTHTPQSGEPATVIRHSSADLVESASVAARFLDSLGITAHSIRVTPLGRVECEVSQVSLLTARSALVAEFDATVAHEPGGVYVDARIDGVPVQVWAGVA